ncbi:MAG: family efflux transporter [Polaromonas sp.]|nr:family efflux transporter [Polaromonas sp.]
MSPAKPVSEIKLIGRHAGTVLIGQLAVMAFGVADTVIAGRYSDAALAALSVGSALYVSVYIGLMGIVQALLPIWSEMLGSARHEAMGRSLRQSLYLCIPLTAVGMSALLFPAPLLRWADVPDAMRQEVTHYLAVLAFAFAPSLLFRIYSSFNQSLGKPLLVTWLQVLALMVKIPLSIWFVAGGAGLHPMGAVGCAWATLAVNVMLMVMALAMLRSQAIYKPFALWQQMEAPDWRQIRDFLRLGVPAGLAYMVEVTSFTLMALFIARLGTEASASHQIAASVAALLYMMPLSISIASSSRVSFWLGAGRPDAARAVVLMSLRLLALISIGLAATLFIAKSLIAGVYSENPDIVLIGSSLLVWVAVYHLADALQALCAFLLRCYRITLAPLLLYGVLMWGLGLYGGYQLTYAGIAGWPPTGSPGSFWIASTVAIVMVAACLLVLLRQTMRRSLKGACALTAA